MLKPFTHGPTAAGCRAWMGGHGCLIPKFFVSFLLEHEVFQGQLSRFLSRFQTDGLGLFAYFHFTEFI